MQLGSGLMEQFCPRQLQDAVKEVRRVHHVLQVDDAGVGGGAQDQHIITSDPEPILLGGQSTLFQ